MSNAEWKMLQEKLRARRNVVIVMLVKDALPIVGITSEIRWFQWLSRKLFGKIDLRSLNFDESDFPGKFLKIKLQTSLIHPILDVLQFVILHYIIWRHSEQISRIKKRNRTFPSSKNVCLLFNICLLFLNIRKHYVTTLYCLWCTWQFLLLYL